MSSRLTPIEAAVHHYPWSVLWILTCLAAVTVTRGFWGSTALVLALIVIVLVHSAHMTHSDHHPKPGRRR